MEITPFPKKKAHFTTLAKSHEQAIPAWVNYEISETQILLLEIHKSKISFAELAVQTVLLWVNINSKDQHNTETYQFYAKSQIEVKLLYFPPLTNSNAAKLKAFDQIYSFEYP